MYNILFFIVIGYLHVHVFSPKVKESNSEYWQINASSSLSVDGKTNINTFKCVVSSYGKTDTLICDLNRGGNTHFKIRSIMDMPVSNFDCHHKIMTKDLQKTLKINQYPLMYIDIKSLNALPGNALTTGSTGDVHISLAGTKVKYQIRFTAKNHQNMIEFKGNKTILFTDFGLTPPSKLGGTIKVKNELEVEVRLHLRKVG
ncbi:MAG: YceI family protein [Saprospiraceae bacterium]|nr:YceI family protein [Saprospiraceae bacterium]